MTLVAAFPLKGIPVLIGDFLLTDNQKNTRHMFMPTRPDLKNTSSTPTRRRMAGLRKKLHKVGERLAVGFTGDLLPGQALMKALVRQFGDSHPTKADLEKFLSEVFIMNKDKIKLVGWLWENRPLCFEWVGSNPGAIQFVNATFSGSGGTHFRDEIMRHDSSVISEEIDTGLEKAKYIAVAQAGKILSAELSNAGNLDKAYGFGAEVILWDGSKFFYVEDIFYQFWNILVYPDNKISTSLISTAVYKNFDTFSVMQISHFGPNATNTGTEAKDTYVTVITPLNDDMAAFDVSTIGVLPYEAPIWFTGIIVHNPLKNLNVTLPHVSDGKDGALTSFRDGMTYFDTGKLKDFLPSIIFNE